MGQDLLSLLSGSLVGAVLALIGGGGSILAVPLLIYVVGVSSPHVAIGTSAVAVAFSALISLIRHVRMGNVHWPSAIVFTAAGVIGAALGSAVGQQFDGQKLLFLFGSLMTIVAALMLRKSDVNQRALTSLPSDVLPALAPRLAGFGLMTGTLAGFFGIGGGFLVVPGLIAATEMSLFLAIGTSLVSVTAFGITTAANYAMSDLIDWRIVLLFVAGGIVGSALGSRFALRLSTRKAALTRVFASIVASTGVYIVLRSIAG